MLCRWHLWFLNDTHASANIIKTIGAGGIFKTEISQLKKTPENERNMKNAHAYSRNDLR